MAETCQIFRDLRWVKLLFDISRGLLPCSDFILKGPLDCTRDLALLWQSFIFLGFLQTWFSILWEAILIHSHLCWKRNSRHIRSIMSTNEYRNSEKLSNVMLLSYPHNLNYKLRFQYVGIITNIAIRTYPKIIILQTF